MGINEKKDRLNCIDIVRGIAMISIVLGHLGNPILNRVVFTYHLPVFFLISGYFLRDNSSYKDFIIKKIKTLIVPYIFSCFLVICSAVIINLLFENGFETKRLIKKWIFASFYGAGDNYTEPFTIVAIGALWFLLATFWGIITLRALLECKWQMRLLVVIALTIIGYVTARLLFWFPFSIQSGCCALFYMYLGYILRRIKEEKILTEISIEIKTVFLIFVFMDWVSFIVGFKSFWLVHFDIGRGFTDIVASLCGSYIILIFSKFLDDKIHMLGNGLAYLGRYSIIFLTAHIIELNTFPWWGLINNTIGEGQSDMTYLIIRICLKFLWIIPVTLIMSKMKWIRKIYGLENQ